MANQRQLETIRYVIYEIQSNRPISQGTCQRRDFPLVVQGLPHGPDGHRAKIMNNQDRLDLTPYDVLLDPNRPAETGQFAYRNGIPPAEGKTIDDAILDVDDLDTEA